MHNIKDKLNANVLSKMKKAPEDTENKLPTSTIFKPPKSDTEYFYYTIVQKDWYSEDD
jgi:hypothetical protein